MGDVFVRGWGKRVWGVFANLQARAIYPTPGFFWERTSPSRFRAALPRESSTRGIFKFNLFTRTLNLTSGHICALLLRAYASVSYTQPQPS